LTRLLSIKNPRFLRVKWAAAQFIELTEKQRRIQRDGPERGYPKDQERTL